MIEMHLPEDDESESRDLFLWGDTTEGLWCILLSVFDSLTNHPQAAKSIPFDGFRWQLELFSMLSLDDWKEFDTILPTTPKLSRRESREVVPPNPYLFEIWLKVWSSLYWKNIVEKYCFDTWFTIPAEPTSSFDVFVFFSLPMRGSCFSIFDFFLFYTSIAIAASFDGRLFQCHCRSRLPFPMIWILSSPSDSYQ